MKLSLLDQSIEKADVLFEISYTYSYAEYIKAKEYALLSLNLSKKINYQKGELRALNRIGEMLVFSEVNVLKGIDYYNNAMKLAVHLQDKDMQFLLLNNIAYASYVLGEYDVSIGYYKKAIEYAPRLNQAEKIMNIYCYLGDIFLDKGDTSSAIQYIERVVSFEAQTDFKKTNSERLVTVSQYFFIQEDYERADKFIKKAIAKLKPKEYRWLSYTLSIQSEINLKLGKTDLAIKDGLAVLEIAEKRKFSKERIDGYMVLSDAYTQKKDFIKANLYLKKYYALKDSIAELEKLDRKNKFESEVDNVLREREDVKIKSELMASNLESEKNQLMIRSIAILLILTVVFLLLLYKRLRKGNRLNKKLREQRKQLQKLSIVAANIEQMVMIVSKKDEIEWVNIAFEKKFGYRIDEVINKNPLTLLGGDNTDLDEVAYINTKIFKEKVASEATLVQYSKDKDYFFTRLHFTPILDDNNELERYVVISHDITEEQEVAEALKELSLVASNTTNSIIIFNADLQVVWVNDSYIKMSGMESDFVIGKTSEEIYDSENLPKEKLEELLAGYKSLKDFSMEIEGINKLTKERYWVSLNITPIFDDEGIIVKHISIATDITEIKTLEKQYSDLIEDSLDMIYEINNDGHFIFANDVLVNRSGYSKEELKSVFYLDLVHEDYKSKVSAFYVNQIVNMEESSYLEFPISSVNNELFWVGTVSQLRLNEKGDKAIGFKAIARDITEQKLTEQKLKKTYDNISLLSDIGMQITATHSVHEIIDKVYDNINKLMDASIFGIAIPNKAQDKLVFLQVIEKGVTLRDFGYDIEDNTRLAVLCFKGGKEIIMDDFDAEYNKYMPNVETTKPIAGEATKSIIYLPLILKKKTIGVITIQSFKEYAYDEHQVSIVRNLASFVAIAMENATLYETMEEEITKRTKEVSLQKEELEVNYFNIRLLSEIGQLVSSTLKIDDIFEELYTKIGGLMSADSLGILIYDEVNHSIDYVFSMVNEVRIKPISISMDNPNSVAVWCVNNRKEVFINDIYNEYKNYVEKIITADNVSSQSLLFYPMIVEGRLVGLITIQSFKQDAYQRYHLDIIKTLASYIGSAIENSLLYDTLETKVIERTEELEQKNKDITASINYAKRLQKGILPGKNFMRQLLPKSFVYFKPKDIIGGDFYWVDRTYSKILMAVVDCTGHGVPGAMMSIIGRNLLDQAVNEKGITLPSQILNFLQVGLSVAFGQTGDKKTDVYDGMDLSLCCIDLKNNILQYAGANSSLYLIQDDELIELKGDRVGISAEYEISNSYTNLEIEIKKGDVIYFTSDGFPDQFGGPRYKKYTYRRMKDFFMEIYKEDMYEQYDFVKNEINHWKGDKEQTDDICIMGVKI